MTHGRGHPRTSRTHRRAAGASTEWRCPSRYVSRGLQEYRRDWPRSKSARICSATRRSDPAVACSGHTLAPCDTGTHSSSSRSSWPWPASRSASRSPRSTALRDTLAVEQAAREVVTAHRRARIAAIVAAGRSCSSVSADSLAYRVAGASTRLWRMPGPARDGVVVREPAARNHVLAGRHHHRPEQRQLPPRARAGQSHRRALPAWPGTCHPASRANVGRAEEDGTFARPARPEAWPAPGGYGRGAKVTSTCTSISSCILSTPSILLSPPIS